MSRATARQALVPVAAVVLVLAVIAAAGNHRWHGTRLTRDATPADRPLLTQPIRATASARSGIAQHQLHVPAWIPDLLVGLLLLVVALIVVLLLRALWPLLKAVLRWRPPRWAPTPVDGSALDPGLGGFADRLRTGADEAASDLEQSRRTSSDAVIACWLRLEDAAAETGVIRQAWQTPSEFTSALLLAQEADPTACAELLALYQRARFGHEHLGSADTEAAVTALRRIAATVGGPDPVPLAAGWPGRPPAAGTDGLAAAGRGNPGPGSGGGSRSGSGSSSGSSSGSESGSGSGS